MKKPVNLLHWFSGWYSQTSKFDTKNKTQFTLNLAFRIEQAYSQLLKITESNSKITIINQRLKNRRRASLWSEGWQGNYNKNLEGHRNCECYAHKIIQESNIVFSNWSCSPSYFSVCFFYFSFALFTIIRTTK